MHYLFIGIGGAIGATLRYIVSILFFTNETFVFPFATVTVNLCGCFLLGLLSSGFESTIKIDPKYLSAIKTGIIGSFTTFSTFSVEMIDLLHQKYYFSAVSYMLISAIFGLAFAYFGMYIGKGIGERKQSL